VSTALKGYLEFPHVEQVFCIERHVTRADGTPLRAKRPRIEVVFGVTSLAAASASPARILELNRGHWSIENRLHYVRDWTFDEDRCRVRKRHAAQTLAALRNFAISLLRRESVSNIAAAVRWGARRVSRVLGMLGL
jgi:Transposase DDE domain